MKQTEMSLRTRAVTYERKSQGDEDKIELSLKSQKRENREYCKDRDFSIIASITEEVAISASIPIADRPGGKQLVNLIVAQQVDHVVVRELSRLCRDIEDSFWFRKLCQKHGVTIHTVAGGPISYADPQSRLTQNFMGVIDEYERDIAADRVRRSKSQKAEDGEHLGGPAPYGYTSQATYTHWLVANGIDRPQAMKEAQLKYPLSGQLYVNEEESKIVRLVFELYTIKRWGSRQICNHLNSLGYRRRSGLPWHPDKVRRLIANPQVAGFIPFDQKRYERGGMGDRTPRHSQKLFPGKHQPIVDEATWRKAQSIRVENTSKNRKNGNSAKANQRHPLSGVMKCQCGASMKAVVSGSHAYLVCRRRRDYGPDSVGGCSFPRVDMRKAEVAFWNAIVEVMLSEELVHRVHEAAVRLFENQSKPSNELPVEKQLEKVVKNIDIWMDRHDLAEFDVERELAYSRIIELTREKKRLQELASVASAKPKNEIRQLSTEDVRNYLKALGKEAEKSKDRGSPLVQLLVEQHGLKVALLDETRVAISLNFLPPGCDSDSREILIPVELVRELPKGQVDAWLAAQEGKHCCSICGKKMDILRRHYWHGIPKYHHKCWASKLTEKRSNPDPSKFYNGSEAAKFLGISRTQFGRLNKSGKVVAVERRSNVLLYSKATIDELAKLGVPKP